ncbi:MAG: hypothetical protein ACRDVD_02190 [Acidimicrobiia bacterium]
MIPFSSYEIAKYRMHQAQEVAAARGLRRTARTVGTYGTPVIDAVGHGLIAIGNRLVSDRSEPPTRRAA